MMNVIVRPEIYTRYRDIIRSSSLLLCEGVVQRQGVVINVVAVHIEPLNEELDTFGSMMPDNG